MSWKLTFANGEIEYAATAVGAVKMAAHNANKLIDVREVPGDVVRGRASWGVKCSLVDASSVMKDWYLMPASEYPRCWAGNASEAQRFNTRDEAQAMIVHIAKVANSMESSMTGPCVPAMRVLGQIVVDRCLCPVELPEPTKA